MLTPNNQKLLEFVLQNELANTTRDEAWALLSDQSFLARMFDSRVMDRLRRDAGCSPMQLDEPGFPNLVEREDFEIAWLVRSDIGRRSNTSTAGQPGSRSSLLLGRRNCPAA
jgi:hypothetical protein